MDSPSAGAEEDNNKEVEQREICQEGSKGVAEEDMDMETEDTEVPGSQAPPPPWCRCLFSGLVWMKCFLLPPGLQFLC